MTNCNKNRTWGYCKGSYLKMGRNVLKAFFREKPGSALPGSGGTLRANLRLLPGIMFVREDGLYISTSHPMNPLYDDYLLNFNKFHLVKEKVSP